MGQGMEDLTQRQGDGVLPAVLFQQPGGGRVNVVVVRRGGRGRGRGRFGGRFAASGARTKGTRNVQTMLGFMGEIGGKMVEVKVADDSTDLQVFRRKRVA